MLPLSILTVQAGRSFEHDFERIMFTSFFLEKESTYSGEDSRTGPLHFHFSPPPKKAKTGFYFSLH